MDSDIAKAVQVGSKHLKRLAGRSMLSMPSRSSLGEWLELVQSHAHRNVSVLNHLGELLETDLAVTVQVGLHNGFVNNLCHALALALR